MDNLFTPYELNPSITLNNRILMAPLTRCMADDNLVPTPAMETYYARRAQAGLIISEGTIIRPDGNGYPNVPGIFTPKQVAGWSRVTAAVHGAGGKMFLQLWHVGRVSHSVYLNGEKPIAPSAVPLRGQIPRRRELYYETARSLETEEIPLLVADWAKAAFNAAEAGFDGVEIHGANGYLVDQFLHRHTNRREDVYGGSIENMIRFPLAVYDAISDEIGSDRVAIRLSPGAYFNQEPHADDPAVYSALLAALDKRKPAYVHTGIFDDGMTFDYLGGTATQFLRANFSGTLVAAGGYTAETASRAMRENRFNLIALGRPFIANPDLITLIREGADHVPYDASMLKNLV